MNNLPGWLPPLLLLTDFKGDWVAFNEAAYAVFVRDIKDGVLSYESRKIVFDGRLSEGKEESFWHITTVIEAGQNARLPDIPRTEKITWLKPIMDHVTDPLISIWKQLHQKGNRSNETRIYIWLESFEYLIVLAERKNHYFLVTAFATDGERTKKKLRKAREDHSKNSRGSP